MEKNRAIKFRCWYDNRMHKVVDIDFAYERINLFGADIINFKDGNLMQYTGLKDKNGKEIYEGDRVYIIPEDEYGEVEWDIESARFIVVYDDVVTDFDNWNGKDLEVVGTIYD